MNKLIVLGVVVLIIFVVGFILNYNKEVKLTEESKVYQGPIRPTDNEEHFRQTGETNPIE